MLSRYRGYSDHLDGRIHWVSLSKLFIMDLTNFLEKQSNPWEFSMVTGRSVLFSASLLCADDNQKESSDPLHCSVKTSLLSSSSFWWSPPRPDQLLLLCSCWLISGTTKTCEDVILCAALQGTVSKQLMMAPLSLADRSDRSIICPDHGQEWRWSTLEYGEQVDNYEEDNFIIA